MYVLKWTAVRVCCNLKYGFCFFFIYRIAIITLICDKTQNPGKPDAFTEEKVSGTESKYVSGVTAMLVGSHFVHVSSMGLVHHEIML